MKDTCTTLKWSVNENNKFFLFSGYFYCGKVDIWHLCFVWDLCLHNYVFFLQCLTSNRGVNAGLSAYLQLILAVWPLCGGKASAMITVSCGGIIPQSRATEMAVSMLSPWRSQRHQSNFEKNELKIVYWEIYIYISTYKTSFYLFLFMSSQSRSYLHAHLLRSYQLPWLSECVLFEGHAEPLLFLPSACSAW